MNGPGLLLCSAQGYLEVGMYKEAWNALEEIPSEDRYAPEVLVVRLEIYRGLEKWEAMAKVAEHLTSVCPEESGHWINLAYARRQHLGLESAEKTLLQALELFPHEDLIHYNLACYVCQQGRPGEAKRWLGRAIELKPIFREIALEDVELEGIW